MSDAGINKQDTNSIISLLMDVSGTTKHVATALNLLKKINFQSPSNVLKNNYLISISKDILNKMFFFILIK